MNHLNKKIGILGGGQLGRMLQEKALEYGFNFYFLDPDIDAPCSIFSSFFHHGNYKNYEDVIRFGEQMDILTIEIEHVNIDALIELEKKGKKIVPNTDTIKMIQNKAFQKSFYLENKIDTSIFVICNDLSEVKNHLSLFPVFQKSQRDGYDGKGVQFLNTEADLDKAMHVPCILEKAVPIAKELAQIIVVNESGQMSIFPICEMVFDDTLNLVDYLLAPASISEDIALKINERSKQIVAKLDSPGIFAIEYFLTPENDILVNEMAPRTHNSGHYSMDACDSSQFDAQFRMLTGLPLLTPVLQTPYAAMYNLIGAEDCVGSPMVEGIESVLTKNEISIHLYGKKETKPGRKMGHINFKNDSLESLHSDIQFVKKHIKIKNYS
jgi:5-(carboxyamino)imidazole ribonucleotide synthase